MKTPFSSIALVIAASTLTISVHAQDITDLDGDGTISVEEVQAARDAAKAQTLALFDIDGDGELSADERSAAKQARRAEAVAEFDVDGDGELSSEERQAARAERRETFAASFDLDDSGDLSETEQANLDAVASEIRSDRGAGKGRGKRRN